MYPFNRKFDIHRSVPLGSLLLLLLLPLLFTACSPTNYIAQDASLLSSVRLTSDNKHVKASDYRLYVRQEANARWFNLVKVPLGIYCLSGNDSTRGLNRFFRRIGEAPVVYNAELTHFSARSLTAALQNKGYLHASVKVDTVTQKKRTKVSYRLHPGLLSYVTKIEYKFDNPDIESLVQKKLDKSHLYKGMPLDVSKLYAERDRIIRDLQDEGYYDLHKEFVTFSADTSFHDQGVLLTFHFTCPNGIDSAQVYRTYRLRKIQLHEERTKDNIIHSDNLVQPEKKFYLRHNVYKRHIYLKADSLYREQDMQDTYSGLNSLAPVSHSSIRFERLATDSALLDANIYVNLNQPNTLSAELEGTNTSGDLGAAVSLTYTNRNFFRGAETFSFKLRGAYEAIKGLEGYSNQNYIEYSTEASLKFPTFRFPLTSFRRNRYFQAVAQLNLLYNSQDRPEFHRRVLTAGWAYLWGLSNKPKWQHRLDLLNLNYVFMPWISETFRKEYLENTSSRYSVLRYSYENLLIMNLRYGFVYNSLRGTDNKGIYQTNGYQIRFGIETAGNLLYLLSRSLKQEKDTLGQYRFFNIAYSQYIKADLDFSKSFVINEHNSLALHAAFGIALPYGNSSIIPYEKRYFAGGANSVRGWSVRELGPGSYTSGDGTINFINQTGNLKLDFSLEYRTSLFWKFSGAAFIDAGNIWNTRNYPNMEGAQFKFDTFFRQIAVSYGIGLRFNFDYFILRLDGGMKAINPSIPHGSGHYPILHPKFSRDFTLHFAVGLPF